MAKAKKQTFILIPGVAEIRRQMMEAISSLDPLIPWKVSLQEYRPSRSELQNKLQWIWHSEWAAHHGETKEFAYNRFKYKYCLPIMLRDDEDGQLTRVWNLVRNDKDAVAGLVKALHTSDLSVPQMKEALDEYERNEAYHGCVFSDPEEYKAARELERKAA